MKYLIIVCPYCGGYQAIKAGQKSKSCPYCGRRFDTLHVKVIAKAENANQASILIRYYKAKKAGLVDKLYGRDEGARV